MILVLTDGSTSELLARLHLMVALNSLRVTRWWCRTASGSMLVVLMIRSYVRLAALSPRPINILAYDRRFYRLYRSITLRRPRTAVVRVAVSWMVDGSSWRLDVDVGNAASLGILCERLVFNDVGVFGDDVPGVEEAGEEAETAEAEIDKGVDGAKTGLDPNCGNLSMLLRVKSICE